MEYSLKCSIKFEKLKDKIMEFKEKENSQEILNWNEIKSINPTLPSKPQSMCSFGMH